MFWSEVRGVLALGRDARRRGPTSLSLLLPVLGRRVPFEGEQLAIFYHRLLYPREPASADQIVHKRGHYKSQRE